MATRTFAMTQHRREVLMGYDGSAASRAKASRAQENAIALEARVSAPNYNPLPVVLSEGRGVWLTDVDGKRYLDMMSGYSAVSLGHGHPKILEAMTRQAARLAVASRAYHADTLGPFLERVARLTGLDKVLPMNTGAEAVETAIKAARRWGYRRKAIPRGQAEIIVAAGNFHGRTTTIIGFSSEPDYRNGFGPFAPGFTAVPFGDAAALDRAVTQNTCAVLIEPIQGEAGILVPPDGYLRALREICDRHGILLILDEVQSGLGRTGKWFAHQHEGIRPDGLISARRSAAASIRSRRWSARTTSWRCSTPARTARRSAATRSRPQSARRRSR
jgi:ornithine--oxo-acid transaminase